MTYQEKLQDPRWQRKKAEVQQAADFTCRECGSKTITLNVHHLYYQKGVEPWDYPVDAFVCLCADCHSLRHEVEEFFNRNVRAVLSTRDLNLFARVFAVCKSPSELASFLIAMQSRPEFQAELTSLLQDFEFTKKALKEAAKDRHVRQNL